MREGMTGADIVFHNAGWYEIGISTSAQRKMQAINVEGTKNVLRLAKELGIKRVVYTSSCVAIGDTGGVTVNETFKRVAPIKTFYEQSKTEAHEIAFAISQCHRRLPGASDRRGRSFTVWILCVVVCSQLVAADHLGTRRMFYLRAC